MTILTFEQFQATKKHVDDIREAVGYDDDIGPRGGYVYDLGCYIEDHADGYFLLIERSDWIDRDLAKLERLLYDNWYVGEATAEVEMKMAAIARKWVGKLGMGFHPDTRGADYKLPLTAAEVAEYEADMETLFATEGDPYEVALQAMQEARQ